MDANNKYPCDSCSQVWPDYTSWYNHHCPQTRKKEVNKTITMSLEDYNNEQADLIAEFRARGNEEGQNEVWRMLGACIVNPNMPLVFGSKVPQDIRKTVTEVITALQEKRKKK